MLDITCHFAVMNVTLSTGWIKIILSRFVVLPVGLEKLQGYVLHVSNVKIHVYLSIAKYPCHLTKISPSNLVFVVSLRISMSLVVYHICH